MNLEINSFREVAWADNSSLVAEVSSAVAELDCTTSEIWLIPCSACSIAVACSCEIWLNSCEVSAMDLIPSTTDSIESAARWAALLPSSTSASELSINCLVSTADCVLCSASLRIWSATTAKPLPASPALAASIDAFRDNRLVWLAISSISEMIFPIFCDVSLIRGCHHSFHFYTALVSFCSIFVCFLIGIFSFSRRFFNTWGDICDCCL